MRPDSGAEMRILPRLAETGKHRVYIHFSSSDLEQVNEWNGCRG